MVTDYEGQEIADPAQVRLIASKSLAELALDVVPSSWSRCLGVDVRDGDGPVLTTEMTFHARPLR
jgi:hypothetical protein